MIGTRLTTVKRWGPWDSFRVVHYDKHMILFLGFAFLDRGPGRKNVVSGGSHRTTQRTRLRKQLVHRSAG